MKIEKINGAYYDVESEYFSYQLYKALTGKSVEEFEELTGKSIEVKNNDYKVDFIEVKKDKKRKK